MGRTNRRDGSGLRLGGPYRPRYGRRPAPGNVFWVPNLPSGIPAVAVCCSLLRTSRTARLRLRRLPLSARICEICGQEKGFIRRLCPPRRAGRWTQIQTSHAPPPPSPAYPPDTIAQRRAVHHLTAVSSRLIPFASSGFLPVPGHVHHSATIRSSRFPQDGQCAPLARGCVAHHLRSAKRYLQALRPRRILRRQRSV